MHVFQKEPGASVKSLMLGKGNHQKKKREKSGQAFPPKKKRFFLGLSPKLWVGGGQESLTF